MNEDTKSIKWRISNPIARAAVASGTVAAFALVTAAPFKWYMIVHFNW
jgi:hypothetical protein